ncbi:hypothetical protein [Specibacter sp. RAF43]|uniref:hypothetical protein n=1 Tax=Specibacter sp. RAF43 TaxID=3233057 RepID=UPI003F98E383
MDQPLTPAAAAALSAFPTDALVCLIVGLDAYQGGEFKRDSADYEELIDEPLLAAVRAELGIADTGLLIEAVQGALEARHTEMRDCLQAWFLWTHRTETWADAMLDAADVIRAKQMDKLVAS